MSHVVTILPLLVTSFLSIASLAKNDLEVVQMAQTMVLQAKNWAQSSSLDDSSLVLGQHLRGGGGGGGGSCLSNNDNNFYYDDNKNNNNTKNYHQIRMAMVDCAKLYDQAEPRLARLLEKDGEYSHDDALAWLSGATTSHRTCLDGLREKGVVEEHHPMSQNLTMVLNEALAFHAKKPRFGSKPKAQGVPKGRPFAGRLTSWNTATSKADIVVARDGSGNYRTIKEAVDALVRMRVRGETRVIVYVKAGVYDETVEIPRHLQNVMFVGDGMGKTVVTGRRNVIDGGTTVNSATFRVFGDGFWGRDMTFENTAGPQKHQAVALMVSSDQSLFYRCSFQGYQDTLYVHSLRQFYRDCHVYGTVDFIFGNAAVVLQNCDIFVRKPMNHQANMITAQGRGDPNENTGISIHGSRIRPAPEFEGLKRSVNTFLGRPWKKYSRTVVSTTDLDGLIHPRGWTIWEGNFALSTLYYAEYKNTGLGATTRDRVNWPGFHVLRDPKEVSPFMVRNFIQGESWITKTGVPVWLEM
ncbi:pectinesterase [Spinacia oleracea]|uniref:Pectinesterase n=1 Tax=Spinacia oleracea TaxID=3562 RepID=A0ABM3R7H9_SPIOL|nr:pectinesterase [Spinacia oleracea]